jgi:hypothetical protein
MPARPFPFTGDAEAEAAADAFPETGPGSDLAGEMAFRFGGEAILSAGSAFTRRPSS